MPFPRLVSLYLPRVSENHDSFTETLPLCGAKSGNPCCPVFVPESFYSVLLLSSYTSLCSDMVDISPPRRMEVLRGQVPSTVPGKHIGVVADVGQRERATHETMHCRDLSGGACKTLGQVVCGQEEWEEDREEEWEVPGKQEGNRRVTGVRTETHLGTGGAAIGTLGFHPTERASSGREG